MSLDQRVEERARLGPRIGIAGRGGQLAQRLQRGQPRFYPGFERSEERRLVGIGERIQLARRDDARRGGIAGRLEPRHRLIAKPHYAARQSDAVEIARLQLRGFLAEDPRQRLLACGEQHLAILVPSACVDRETEAVDPPDRLVLDPQRAILVQRDGQQVRVFPHAFHQYSRPPVDEPLGQPRVERVRQAGLDRAGACGHLVARQHPVGSLADICPGADRGYPPLQRRDVARHIVEFGDPRRDEVRPDSALLQVAPEPRDEAGMLVDPRLPEIGQRAGFPEAAHEARPLDAIRQRLFGEALEHGEVDRFGGGAQFALLRFRFEIGDKGRQRIIARFGIAPEQVRQRREAVFLDCIDVLVFEFGHFAFASRKRSEGSVALVAARPTGDLRHLGRRQAALPHPVELGQRGEGDVVQVEIEPHADGVGRDDVIDLARLEELDLAVAGFGAQGAHHHRRAAAIAPQHFRGRVDTLRTEGDHRAAFRQAGQLARADMG